MSSSLLFSVAREIPKDALLGLMTGAMSLHGGVVRDSAGRIVAHLALPAAGSAVGLVPGLNWVAQAFQSYQLHQIGLTLETVRSQMASVMQLATATTALSGLNLVVSMAGIAFMSGKLQQICASLERIEKATRKTNDILTAVQHGRLQGAIDGLRHASQARDDETRRNLLMQSKQTFTELVHQYKMLWKRNEPSAELKVVDDCFTLAMIGAAVATSDLGLVQPASDEFNRHYNDWQSLARDHVVKEVIGDQPQRLLQARLVKALPSGELIRLLDFGHQTRKGVAWIDELRTMEAQASMFRIPNLQSTAAEEAAIDFARKLTAKHDVLDGQAAHFAFLAEQDMSAGEFNRQLDALMNDQVEPMWLTVEAVGCGSRGQAVARQTD